MDAELTQEQALADGRVTSAELSSLAHQYVACLQRLGLSGEIHFDAEQVHFQYHFWSPHKVEPILESEAGQACHRDTLALAEYRWADDHSRRPANTAAFYEAVGECLASHSLPHFVGSATEFESLYRQDHQVAMTCFDSVYEQVLEVEP